MSYIGNLKQIIQGFAATARKYAAAVEENDRRYLPDIAQRENDKLEREFMAAFDGASARLDEEQDAVLATIDRWATLDGSEIDSADMQLLTGAFDLTVQDIEELAERYSENYTMLRALQAYVDKHNRDRTPEELARNPFGTSLSDLPIPTPERRREAVGKFHSGALSMLSSIKNTPAGSPMLDLGVENFGMKNILNTQLISILENL